jgi:hypothetical protein
MHWLVLIGIVLAVETAVILVGLLIASATGERAWLTYPALIAPPVAVAFILLSRSRPGRRDT